MKAVYRFVPTYGRVKKVTIPVRRVTQNKEVRFFAETGFEVNFKAKVVGLTTFENSTVQIVGSGMYLPPVKLFPWCGPSMGRHDTAKFSMAQDQSVASIL